MATWGELRGKADVWPGFLDRADITDSQFQEGSYLDDCAKVGNWKKVLEILNPGNHLVNINQWRPASNSQSTVLHRAAENGAPIDVMNALIQRGAFRALRDGNGVNAYQIAEASHQPPDVVATLMPEPSPLEPQLIAALDSHLASVLDWWLEPLCGDKKPRTVVRYPPVAVLHEPQGQELWVQAPKVSGGFRLALRSGLLELLLGYREFQDSGNVRVKMVGFEITDQGVKRGDGFE